MSLLPSKPDTAAADEAEPRVVGVESDDADELLSALSSATARRLLGELHEEPAPPAELSERVDTSLQNAQYHLEKLEGAGAVTVVDTAYSEKGREMDVYAPADQPLVIFAGNDDDTTSIRTALTRLLGGLGALFGTSSDSAGGGAAGTTPTPTVADAAAARTPTPAAETATPAPSGGAGQVATDAAAGLPPGVVFFLGGATVLLVGFAAWYLSQ